LLKAGRIKDTTATKSRAFVREPTDSLMPGDDYALLRAIGWAIVPLDIPKNHHRDSAP
jgi:hypothetical protein